MAASAPDLLVAAALRLEARALRRGAPGLPVLRVGMGPARARRAAVSLAASPARRLLVAGLAGGVEATQPLGQVVVASELRTADAEALPCEHEALVAALRSRGIEPRVGPVASVDHVVRGAERDALRERGVVAVDMESAWLGRASGQRPLAVLRVVLDTPGREIARPGIALDVFRALRRLAETAPALLAWAPDAPIRSRFAEPARPA